MLTHPLHPLLQQHLEALGLARLYSHQVEAIDALLRGEHVVVATPAASGKSLCYHIPVLQALLEERAARALLIYPTKALAQDQQRSLTNLAPPQARLNHAIYDGDTPLHQRAAIRRSSQILLTNPEMLHVGILPNHHRWARLFQRLRYVVVDEAHLYRGVFGSHMANLLRRLRRLCQRYGADPRFVLCSATIGNPDELAERLIGLPFRAVTQDGAPYGGKSFAFWNPPLIDEKKSTRRSAASEAVLLFTALLRRQVRTLTFVRTRRMAELVFRSVQNRLREEEPSLAQRVAPYRGTYLPEERRRIERDLFEGRLLGVAATNALELGIDIGDLDATVLTGYPGSIASTWQQAGRSGRRGYLSLSILVARDNPLDQYLMRYPSFFFGRPQEHARIAPENPYILKPHLLCAAYETPLTVLDEALFGASYHSQVQELTRDGLLREVNKRWFLDSRVNYPAEQVKLRAVSSASNIVVNEESGQVLEEGIEESAAFAQLHPGAIYLHQGDSYMVKRLDLVDKAAYVDLTDVPYYTQARELVDTRILKVHGEKRAPGGSRVFLGEVEVSSQVVAY
ncbi:MAG: DEAD/DEAH box helicase, partial [Chloroflexi bacterium]|nr:DEAD/DEAH box helicase [Chloroflexota bacterium]